MKTSVSRFRLLIVASCTSILVGSIRLGTEGGDASVRCATDLKPLTISASTVGRFAEGHSWYLSVNSAGQAELTVETYPEPIRRQFQIAPAQMSELRNAIAAQRFFDLAGEYGQAVPDGSTTTLTLVEGDRVKSVRIRFLMNWVHGDAAKLVDPSRAVRILVLIRGWFQESEAVDLRKYHQAVLDAVDRRTTEVP